MISILEPMVYILYFIYANFDVDCAWASKWEVWRYVELVKGNFVQIPAGARPNASTIGEVDEELKARFHQVPRRWR